MRLAIIELRPVELWWGGMWSMVAGGSGDDWRVVDDVFYNGTIAMPNNSKKLQYIIMLNL